MLLGPGVLVRVVQQIVVGDIFLVKFVMAMIEEGGDAAQKISLLASISFGCWIDYRRILVEGITHITPEEIAFARFAGFVFKLLAEAKLVDNQPAVVYYAGSQLGP